MRIKFNTIYHFFVVLALVAATFASGGKEFLSAVPTAVLACMAGFRLARSGRGLASVPRDRFGLSLGIFLAVVGMLGGLINQDTYSSFYAIFFLLTWVSVFVVRDIYPAEQAIRATAQAGVISTILFLVLTRDLFMSALAMEATTGGATYRYNPFDIHPNLIGHIFGVYAIAMIWQALLGRGLIKKIVYLGVSAIALAFCLAASSRGGLFAALIGIGAGALPFLMRRKRTRLGIFILTPIVLAVAIPYLSSVSPFLSELLQLDSKYRGVGSGLTGRTEGWAYVVDHMFSGDFPLVIGKGFRNEWMENLSFSIDNGYLVLMIELGIPALLLVLYRIASLYWKILPRFKRFTDPSVFAAFSIVVFFLAESVVARYFIAVGNPASILFIFLLLNPLLAPLSARERATARHRAATNQPHISYHPQPGLAFTSRPGRRFK